MWKVQELDSQSRQSNHLQNVFLLLSSLVLGITEDNVTEWDIRSWCQQPGLPVGQRYKMAMSVP